MTADDEPLPMFPLGGVLFPGRLLPLQVFEPRYHQLVHDCLRAEVPEFGVVLIERGSEVGGGDRRHDVGCVARILQVQEFGPGRLALLTGGVRRLRVQQWLEDDPYPRAIVGTWPEEPTDTDLGEVVAEAVRRTRRSRALASELGDRLDDLDEEALGDPLLASLLLSAAAPLGPSDRHRLLCCAGPDERFALLLHLLDEVDEVLRFRLGSA